MSSNHFSDTSTSDAPCKVKRPPVHGNGVFASRHIDAGARIIEYLGERIGWLDARTAASDAPLNHPFYFSLDDGHVTDGASQGNDARWINHACEPNCEACDMTHATRHTPAVKRAFGAACAARPDTAARCSRPSSASRVQKAVAHKV